MTPSTSVMAFNGPGVPSNGIPSSRALGFGEITVFSKLNEPLKVHIELVDSKSTPIDDITVKNASRDIYRRANLPRPDAFNRIRFKTTKLAKG